MILSELKFNLPVAGAEETAFIGGRLEDGKIVLKKGETVDFGTYFNSFDARFFANNTTVTDVRLRLKYNGRASVVVYRYRKKGKVKNMSVRYICERTAGSVCENECEITVGTARKGVLGFTVTAETDLEILGGGWECADSCAVNEIRAGIVVCAYKREKEAKRNIDVLYNSVGAIADIYVVDNGGTLEEGDMPEGVLLIKNRNLGGSGGFSRGILECYENKNTHFLLMDDDIVFHGETVKDTLRILSVLSHESKDISLGGGMMSFSAPSVIYEAGAYVGGARLRLPKHNVKVAEKGGLVWCASKARVNYSGWWYYCAPVSAVKKKGMPMPFFIKYDDAEYGLRTSKLSPVKFPLGIGVWHQDFETKLPPYMYYYLRRNSLITSAASGNGSIINALIKLFGSLAMFALKDRVTLAYVFDGFDDYLKGTDFLENIDGEELNSVVKNAPSRIRGIAGSIFKAISLSIKIVFLSKKINAGYRANRDAMCSVEAWKRRCDMDSDR